MTRSCPRPPQNWPSRRSHGSCYPLWSNVLRQNVRKHLQLYPVAAGEVSVDEERYDKHRLVPFAEYFPLTSLLNTLLDSELNLGSYTPGQDAKPFLLDGGKLGGIICFESYFPRPALDVARQGAEHLFVLTNDAWFLESQGLQQHLRAVCSARQVGIDNPGSYGLPVYITGRSRHTRPPGGRVCWNNHAPAANPVSPLGYFVSLGQS